MLKFIQGVVHVSLMISRENETTIIVCSLSDGLVTACCVANVIKKCVHHIELLCCNDDVIFFIIQSI